MKGSASQPFLNRRRLVKLAKFGDAKNDMIYTPTSMRYLYLFNEHNRSIFGSILKRATPSSLSTFFMQDRLSFLINNKDEKLCSHI